LIGAGFILEKSWTIPEVPSPTETSRRNFSFSTTLISAAQAQAAASQRRPRRFRTIQVYPKDLPAHARHKAARLSRVGAKKKGRPL
jgi:hypothetical protein